MQVQHEQDPGQGAPQEKKGFIRINGQFKFIQSEDRIKEKEGRRKEGKDTQYCSALDWKQGR